jgi:C4-dicarboxylate-specific signal transduction histidine kinase
VYAIQISVPVMAEGKPVGALVVGVNLTHLEKLAKQ